MLRWYLISVLLVCGAHAGEAQTQRDGFTDSSATISVIFPRLFEGVALTPEQTARAKSLIWRTQTAQNDAATQRDGYDMIRRLQAQRDSSLAAMLTSDEARAKFEANAAKMRPAPIKRP